MNAALLERPESMNGKLPFTSANKRDVTAASRVARLVQSCCMGALAGQEHVNMQQSTLNISLFQHQNQTVCGF